MENLVFRVGVQSAYKMAMKLYPSRLEAIAAVARELCMTPEAVEEALAPETVQ